MENHNHEKMEHVYEQVPPDYWDRAYKNPVQWLYHFWRFRAIRRLIDKLPKGAKILDVGCGSGFAIEKCVKNRSDLEVYGIDVALALIQYAAERRPQFKFEIGKSEKLPFSNNEFDALLYLDTIEHFVDPVRSLSEARRVLKENGILIVLVVLEGHPLFQLIWKMWLRLRGKVWHEAHLRVFTKNNLKELLNNSGFKIVKFSSLFLGMSVLAMAKK